MGKETPVDFKSRLTLKELGCEPAAVLEMTEPKPKMPLANVYGTVSRIQLQEDLDRGQTYTSFIGHFEGVNLQTGETIQSSKMFLPEGASQTLEHIVNQVHARRKGAMVNFAFEIFAVRNEDTRGGYAYETRTILRPEQNDLLGQIREFVKKEAGESGTKKSGPEPAKKTA